MPAKLDLQNMMQESKQDEILDKNNSELAQWNPTTEQKQRIQHVLIKRADMVMKRNQRYVQFNDRTLKEFIDDSEKRLNAYVLDKATQGKEEWQANFATRAYANKAKALLAAAARDIPDMHFKAVNEDDQFNHFAADTMKNLVNHSYNQGSPQEELFFIGWGIVGKGTGLSYEGFEKQTFVKKRIKSYDLLTGDVQEEIMEKASFGEPVSFEIGLMDLLIDNFYIRDVQDQPCIIWETYYADRERFEAGFGKYANSIYVKDASDMNATQRDTYFHKQWAEGLASGKGFLVSRYMNKYKDVYRIVCNGVELFNGPMLWIDVTRKNFGRKIYPIAKTIYEPFANGDFFYGNSMPNSAMGEGDTLNTLYNTSLDKQYRSMVPPLLIGMVNKDMLDLEDEVVAGDTKIYVDDINQIKQMELQGISQSDVQMIDLISKGLDLTTVDPQQEGSAQKYVTARASLGADERAKQLKGIFFMFLESLWLQKVRLRVPNILLAYTQPKLVEIIGEDNTKKLVEKYRLFNVENAKLSDGAKGTLGIQFAPKDDVRNADKKRAMRLDIEAEEYRNKVAGKPYEKIILPYGFLDRISFDIEIIPETLWQSSQSINMAMVLEKVELISKIFPEYFAANKELLFGDLIKNYNDNVGRYQLPKTMDYAQQQGLEMAKAQAGAKGQKKKGGGSAGGGVASDITGAGTNQGLAQLTGVG